MIGPIYVYGDWYTLKSPTLIGKLNVESLRGKEVFSFEYDERWLESKEAPLFDPDLQLPFQRQTLVWDFCRFVSGSLGKNASAKKRSNHSKKR